jgi:branched-chain amino acid transport system substrate-binding protein
MINIITRGPLACGPTNTAKNHPGDIPMQISSFKLTLLSAAILTGTSVLAQDSLRVRIGIAAPTSGPAAHLGADNVNGASLAIDDLNAANLKIGGKAVRFELQVEDDMADPKQATMVAQKFCDQKVNGVVGHLTSGAAIPAAKIYNNCGIPHISPTATNPKLTELGYKTTFRLIASDNSTGIALAHYIHSSLKLNKVAIIDDRTAYGQGLSGVFRKAAKQDGLQIVDEQYTSDKAVEFAAILTTIKSKGAEAIFFAGLDAQAGPMLRQMTNLGMNSVKFLGGDGICVEKLTELAGGASNVANVTCASGGQPIEAMPKGPALKARYDAKFPKVYQGNAPYGYEAVVALAEAMKVAGSVDPKVYAPVMFKIDYAGTIGKVSFDADGDLRNPGLTVVQFPNGKLTPIK